MTFKECVEEAFGMDAEKRILRFLQEEELAGLEYDSARGRYLLERCTQWRRQFLLWEDNTYIDGIHGWNLNMSVYKLRLPEMNDWPIYLYRMTLLAVVSGMSVGERNCLAVGWRNFSTVADDYYVNGDYVSLTREQWLKELNSLVEHSWEKYQRFPGTSSAYHREMEKNYPKFNSILDDLAQNIKACEVVRMNQFGGDDTIWYFVKTSDCFYLLSLSDSM